MSNTKSLWAGAVAAIMVSLSACAATPAHRSAGQVVDDVTLTTRVKTALIESPKAEAHDIDVDVYKGNVQLNGFVESQQQKVAAGKIASQVKGVRSVHNNLQLQAANRTGGKVLDDTVITTKVKAALIGDSRTKAYQIEVTTEDGQVQLGGFVDTQAAKTAATQIASNVSGVKSVNNELEVRG